MFDVTTAASTRTSQRRPRSIGLLRLDARLDERHAVRCVQDRWVLNGGGFTALLRNDRLSRFAINVGERFEQAFGMSARRATQARDRGGILRRRAQWCARSRPRY